MPSWGKGTKGFKVSNVWIGKEYFELVRIKRQDGGGWIEDWTDKYNEGHRGLIGFALEVEDIEKTYQRLLDQKIKVTPPEPLQFRWFFSLLTKTMPWRNSYLPALKGVPFQFFLQQLNDEKSKNFMEQYMVPNSRDHGIEGISEVVIYGHLEEEDRKILFALFDQYEESEGSLKFLMGTQAVHFIESDTYRVDVKLNCTDEAFANKSIDLHNLHIMNA